MSEEDNKIVDGEEEEEETLPAAVLKRVLGLRKLHAEVEEIDSAYKAERVQLEMKYLALKAPLFDRRKQIIAGDVEPVFPAPEEGSTEPAPASVEGEDIKGVPSFWLQALANHPVTADILQQEDTTALESLEDIKIVYDETYNTFTLFFEFKENEFFSNRVLSKKYSLTDILDEKGPQLLEVVGTEIEWKEGKNLCMKEIKKKQKAKSGKNKGQVRQITKLVPKPSFFHFFSEPKSEEDEEEEDEGKEEEEERITLSEEEDYEVAHAIRTCLIPDAVLWYTGEARDDEDYDEDDLEEEDDEGEDDEDDDEEEEEEDAGKKKGKGGKGNNKPTGFAAPSSGTGGEQPECKQN